MVRCSIRRGIKWTLCLLILTVLTRTFLFQSRHAAVKQVTTKDEPLLIAILASERSRTIQRLMLFLDELRVTYIQLDEASDKIDAQLTSHLPSVIVLDHAPNAHLSAFIAKHQISVLTYLQEPCEHCMSMAYSDMLYENMSYSTIDFSRDHLEPRIRTTASPFRIQASNAVIRLLRFDTVLPHFHDRLRLTDRCTGLPTTLDRTLTSVIYARHRITSVNISLMTVSAQGIRISDCLTHHWFIWPLMMDSLKYLTSGRHALYGLERYIQIDIDDIFLGGKSQDRLTTDDVHALMRSQVFLQQYMANFRYRLGFSGHYFNSSDENEDNGNRLLISALFPRFESV